MKQIPLFEHNRIKIERFVEYVWTPRPFRPVPTEQIKLPLVEDQELAYQRRSPFAASGPVSPKSGGSPHRYAPDIRLMSLTSLLELAQSQAGTSRARAQAGVGIDIGIDLPADLQLSAEMLVEMAFSGCVVAQESAGRLRIVFGLPLLIRLAACASISRSTPITVYVTKASNDVALLAAAIRSLPRPTTECMDLATALLKSPSAIQDHLQWGRRGVEAMVLDIAGISKPTFVKLSKRRRS